MLYLLSTVYINSIIVKVTKQNTEDYIVAWTWSVSFLLYYTSIQRTNETSFYKYNTVKHAYDVLPGMNNFASV